MLRVSRLPAGADCPDSPGAQGHLRLERPLLVLRALFEESEKLFEERF